MHTLSKFLLPPHLTGNFLRYWRKPISFFSTMGNGVQQLRCGGLSAISKRLFLFFIFGAVYLWSVPFAHAVITQNAPPVDVLFKDSTVGGGAVVPLTQFRLIQSDGGSDTLDKIGVRILASSTMSDGEVSRISLWKESGVKQGFQINEDVFLPGAASTTPNTSGVLILLDPADPVFIGSSPVEFFVIATTTSVGGITNGHGFDMRMQNNYASTTLGSGVGTAFVPARKISLNQSATLKISEVKSSSATNVGDEFVELYNSGEVDINLKDLPLNLHVFYTNGSSSPVALTYFNKYIPSHGYFLLASQNNYSGSASPDAVFSTSSVQILLDNGGLSIATSSGINSTSTAIDRIGWGSQPIANGEGGAAPANLGADKSYERKATTSAVAVSMASGGFDAIRGNGHDLNDNRLDNDGNFTDAGDFVEQAGAAINPQNSMSPREFSFGGGVTDSEKPKVINSFPGPNMTNVSLDMSFIGFEFNKVVATSTIVSATATTTVKLTIGGSGNLCTSVSYNPFPGNFEPPAKCNLSGNLSANTTYTFTATSSIYDQSGNALDQNPFEDGNQPYQITFTIGGAGQTTANVTPPVVTGTTPFQGGINVPINIAKILVKFNQSSMDVSTLTSVNIALESPNGTVAISGFSFNSTTSQLSFTPPALSANTPYKILVGPGVKNSNGIGLPFQYISQFTTGSAADYTAPTIVGVMPASNTTLPLNSVNFVFMTDDMIDPSTATSGAVTLSSGGNNLPGAVSYDPVAKEGSFTATNLLPANITDLTLSFVAGAMKNITGSSTAAKLFGWSTEATNSDSTGPSVLFANADEFGLAVTFNEAVKIADAETLANYVLNVGGSTTTLSSLAGHRVSYGVSKRTAKITGLFMQSGASFTITASNIKDVSGNAMPSSNSFTGTVLSKQVSGGYLGPGEGSGNFMPPPPDFSFSGIGFMPGTKVMPMNAFISASTTYGFEIPLSKQIPADGTIVITLPSTSDYGVCCAATSSVVNPFINEQNKDINGPGPLTIGVKNIVKDNAAKTVTLTLDNATRLENSDTHDFLRFALNDIKNPSVSKGADSSGYTIDIKTKNAAGTLLESFTSNPIYISGGSVNGSATTTISGKVTGNGGNLQSVTIRMMSPQIGMMEATTNGSGDYSFGNVPVNDQISTFGSSGSEYMIFTDPFITPAGTTTPFFGEPMPTPVRATSTSLITRNFALTATSSAVNFTVKLTGDNSSNGIFKAGENIDVFAGGPNRFTVRTYSTAATNYNDTTIMLLPLPQVNGSWGIGIGPAMPKSMGSMNFGPPPSPAWAVPKPIELVVAGCPSACTSTINGSTATTTTFTVSSADKSIIGILKDVSGNVISSAEVFAFSPANGVGNRSITSPSGVFTIKVTTGSYNVGAFIPGMGSSQQVPVAVNSSNQVFVDGSTSASTGSSGANPFTLTMKKPGFTITGKVTDGTNAVSNAPVFAYRTDAPGHSDAMTDTSGNYTMYVDNGSWKVGSFIPGFGPMTEQSVTVSGSSKADINFSPSTSLTFRNLSGIVFESGDANIATSTEGISGVIVRVSGANGSNETVTGSDGIFSLRIPSGSYTFVDIFKPGYGRIAALDHTLTAIGTMDLSSGNLYKPIRSATRDTVVITIRDSSDAALVVPKAFIDLFDQTTRLGNHAEITNGTTTSLLIGSSSSPTIRAFIQGVSPANISVASDHADTVVSSGVLTVDHPTERIKITVNTTAAALSTVSGTIYVGSASIGNELADSWVQFVDTTNNVHFGTQATSSGVYQIKVANGTYQVQAMKPGYISTPTTVTVSGNTSTANIIVSQAASSITGTVTAGGSATSEAFVWAEKLGGGFASTKTNTSGAYTLPVDTGQWKVFAASERFQKTAYASNPVSSGATGIIIALTTAASIDTKVVTSNTFTDTSSGTFSDSTVGASVSLDSGALGSSGSTAYMSARETANVPETSDINVIGDKAVDIDAVSGSSAITNLQTGKKAEIALTYTKAELATDGIDTTTEVGNLKIVSWSDDKKAWESLTTVATYKDSDGNSVASPASNLSNVASVEFKTTEASHFSEYALGGPSNADAPALPSGLAATQPAGNNNVTVSWSANGESDLSGYILYRDTSSTGSFPKLADVGNVVSYSDRSLIVGTTYYYKVSAYDTGSNESAASAAKSILIATPTSGSGSTGGGGSPSIGESSGGGASAAAPAPATTPAPSVAKVTPAAPGVAKPSVVAMMVSPVFNKNLEPGSRGDDVKRLQEVLKQDKEIYPEGDVTGFFGPKTAAALKRFQKKHSLPQVGRLGPATRAKVSEVFWKAAAEVPTAPKALTAETQALIKSLQDQIKELQAKLLQMQLKLLQDQLKGVKK